MSFILQRFRLLSCVVVAKFSFFTTVTFRFGHSAILEFVKRIDLDGAEEDIELGEAFFRPSLALGQGRVDSLLKVSTRVFSVSDEIQKMFVNNASVCERWGRGYF